MALVLACALTFVGVLSSGATLWIYALGVPSFDKCGDPETACEAVINSSYGSPLGIPLPLLGILGFSVVLGLLLDLNGRWGFLLGPLCGIAAVAGLTLLGIQVFALEERCTFCVAADLSAITLGGVVLFAKLPRENTEEPPSSESGWGWLVLAVFALVLSFPAYWIMAMTSGC